MESNGVVDRVCVSQTVYEQLKDTFSFEQREAREIKGLGMTHTYLLVARLSSSSPIRPRAMATRTSRWSVLHNQNHLARLLQSNVVAPSESDAGVAEPETPRHNWIAKASVRIRKHRMSQRVDAAHLERRKSDADRQDRRAVAANAGVSRDGTVTRRATLYSVVQSAVELQKREASGDSGAGTTASAGVGAAATVNASATAAASTGDEDGAAAPGDHADRPSSAAEPGQPAAAVAREAAALPLESAGPAPGVRDAALNGIGATAMAESQV